MSKNHHKPSSSSRRDKDRSKDDSRKKHDPSKLRRMDTHGSSYRPSAQGSSCKPSSVLTYPGPHGSVSLRAVHKSPFVDVSNGSYILRDGAYVKEVFGAGGSPIVVMNCAMSVGVLVKPNVRQARFDYPDGTFMTSLPICDVRILNLKTIYRRGKGREFIHSASEVYGRDSVMLDIRTRIVETIKQRAYKVFTNQYEGDEPVCVGNRSASNPSITIANALVRPGARVMLGVDKTRHVRFLSQALDGNSDVMGDALMALKYVRDLKSKKAELIFEVQDIVVRTLPQVAQAGSSSQGKSFK